MTTRTKIVSTIGGSLVIFTTVAAILFQLGHTKFPHGDIVRSERTMYHTDRLLKAQGWMSNYGERVWNPDTVTLIAQRMAEWESQNKSAIIGFDTTCSRYSQRPYVAYIDKDGRVTFPEPIPVMERPKFRITYTVNEDSTGWDIVKEILDYDHPALHGE